MSPTVSEITLKESPVKTQSNASPIPPLDEAALQAIAQKMGAQISHVVCGNFIELLVLLKEQQKQLDASSTRLMSLPALKPLLTAVEVARALNISKAQAYQLIRRKEIRSFSVGKLVRVRLEDLETFIQEHLSVEIENG